MRRFSHECAGRVVLVERDEQGLGTGDRPEEREDEVREDVAVPVEGGDHERVSRRADEKGEGRVDQLWFVGNVGMPLGGRVHLLLEHPLVDRADGVLGPAEDFRARSLRVPERELGNGAADAALDPLGPIGDFVLALALAPFLRAVGVTHGHAHHADRVIGASDRYDTGNSPAGADDHVPADLLAQDPVRAADVVFPLRSDGGRLQSEPGVADRCGRLVNDGVLRCATVFEREVVARKLELEAQDVSREHASCFLEQLLPGLVPLEHHDRPRVHGAGV